MIIISFLLMLIVNSKGAGQRSKMKRSEQDCKVKLKLAMANLEQGAEAYLGLYQTSMTKLFYVKS